MQLKRYMSYSEESPEYPLYFYDDAAALSTRIDEISPCVLVNQNIVELLLYPQFQVNRTKKSKKQYVNNN